MDTRRNDGPTHSGHVRWTLVPPPEIAPGAEHCSFTTYPGRQTDPAFSPDGKQVAFAWDGNEQFRYLR